MKNIELTKDMIDDGLTLYIYGSWNDWSQLEGQIIKIEEYRNYYDLTNKNGKIIEFKKQGLKNLSIIVRDNSNNYKEIYEREGKDIIDKFFEAYKGKEDH